MKRCVFAMVVVNAFVLILMLLAAAARLLACSARHHQLAAAAVGPALNESHSSGKLQITENREKFHFIYFAFCFFDTSMAQRVTRRDCRETSAEGKQTNVTLGENGRSVVANGIKTERDEVGYI